MNEEEKNHLPQEMLHVAGGQGTMMNVAAKPPHLSNPARPQQGTSYPYHQPSVEEQYQQLSDVEIVLKRPDTFTGSTGLSHEPMWVLDLQWKGDDDIGNLDEKKSAPSKKEKEEIAPDEDNSKDNQEIKIKKPKKPRVARMEYRKIHYVPALYKIFDEILVNASDQYQREPTMDTLKVDINAKTGEISVWNNGRGLRLEMHNTAKMYVPEFIFGHMRTGSNYNDEEKRTTGGRNGYGAKLANIFSLKFRVDATSAVQQLHYVQEWKNNMSQVSRPEIKKCATKQSGVAITFLPDYARLGIPNGLDADHLALLQRRVYDIAGTANRSPNGSGPGEKKKLKVFLNGERINIQSFSDYVSCFVDPGQSIALETVNESWQVAVTASVDDEGFRQASFVNNIETCEGGSHVDLVVDQVVKSLMETAQKKAKGVALKPGMVRSHLFVFVNALIHNPAFDSQSKRKLKTARKDFGSTCELSDKFMTKVGKGPIMSAIVSLAMVKQSKELNKSDYKPSDKTKIEKLEEATAAGGKEAHKCTLILTEGDSAKALAMAGLSVVGRKYYGVFPLRGKFINVREDKIKTICANKEFVAIKRILGLKNGDNNADKRKLRYGHVMIMTDQDHDGSHIKGLLINMFEHYWPDLLKQEDFLQEFITPIVKCSKRGQPTQVFFTIPEYQQWKEKTNDGRGWTIKYYKGLGTSTSQEAKEYFSDLDTHKIVFRWTGDVDAELIDMAFHKKKANARKQWIGNYQPGQSLDHAKLQNQLTYSDFINKELILFSIANNERAIPSLVDGLKPGQRKILYAALKRNLIKELKVASFTGYVIEQTAYHHGETSLASTIVNMAQGFVGSNNINLLMPCGQFGTRAEGGKNHASARYINTFLASLTRAIFPPADDAILPYLNDDGRKIEPQWYLPVLPMVLVNGCSGIGTGWATDVPSYNPRAIIHNIRLLLNKQPTEALVPWYRGWKGTLIEKPKKDGWIMQGVVVSNPTDCTNLIITELPLSKTPNDYRDQLLQKLVDEKKLLRFEDESTEDDIRFLLYFTDNKQKEAAIPLLKLQGNISQNLVLFSPQGKLRKYESPNQILEEFVPFRLGWYEIRKQTELKTKQAEILELSNRARFIAMVVRNELKIMHVPQVTIMKALWALKFALLPRRSRGKGGEESKKSLKLNDVIEDDNGEDQDQDGQAVAPLSLPVEGKEPDLAILKQGYDYLLTMPIRSLTMELADSLQADLETKQAACKTLEATPSVTMWLRDLDHLETNLLEWEKQQAQDRSSVVIAKTKEKTKPKTETKKRRVRSATPSKKGISSSSKTSQSNIANESPTKKQRR